jgi:hypothetical protein
MTYISVSLTCSKLSVRTRVCCYVRLPEPDKETKVVRVFNDTVAVLHDDSLRHRLSRSHHAGRRLQN